MAPKRIETTKGQQSRSTKSNHGVKKRTQSRETNGKTRKQAATTPFRFLDLPAEIRNSIYELVLRRKKPITINHKLEVPPLLWSRCQIENEASSIWYRDNMFRASVKDCNARALIEFTEHSYSVGEREHFNPSIELQGYVKWENLVEWCYYIWSNDEAHVVEYGRDTDDEDDEYEENDEDRINYFVWDCQNLCTAWEHKPWSVCLNALEQYKKEKKTFGDKWMFRDPETYYFWSDYEAEYQVW